MDDLIISVFYEIDNFCKKFIPYMEQQCIQIDDKPVPLELPSRLTLSEAMTICAAFHLSEYRTFKWFYKKLVLKDYGKFFPNLVSYNRFVELMPYTALPMVFFAYSRGGKCTGTSFVDSTTIDVCDSHRIQQHKVFKDIAQRGKSSTGWFYGFKLHISINELMAAVKYLVSVLHMGIKMTGIMKLWTILQKISLVNFLHIRAISQKN